MNEFVKELVTNGVVLIFGTILSVAMFIKLHKCMQVLDKHLYALVYGEDDENETDSDNQEGV